MQNKLKDYREKVGISQMELAKKSGVSRNTISALETGASTNLTRDTMEKLANALDEKVTSIFFET